MNLYTHVERKCSRVCLCRNIGQLLAVNNLLDQLAIYCEVFLALELHNLLRYINRI